MSELKRLVCAGLLIIAAGMIGLGGWTILAPLSGAIVAPAFVKVDLNRKVVQHQEGGIVREIRVRDGDTVKQGQTLVVLEDVKVDSTLDLLSIQLIAERAKEARLGAEASFAPKPGFPADIGRREREPRVAEILERERALFQSRRSSVDSQVAALRVQIGETQAEAAALAAQLAAEERAIALQKEELTANEELLRQNYVQKIRVLTLQRAVAEYEVKHGEHRAELARSRQKASELELRIITARNSYKQNAVDELKDTTAHIFDLEERLRPSRDAAARQQVLAPNAGEVVGLRVFTPGAVVGPRDVLMEIVPAEKTLILEARIRPEDINHVAKGTPADVRLTAYKQRTTPLVVGRVSYVSGDRLMDSENKNAPYYVAQIEVAPGSLGDLKMQAGMPAEVFIRTDSRTAFDYLLAPVTAYLRRAMREPV
ncbi:MAG: HlyD family type I secretion periplasmic adaptor subunit [Betaproteobacteria bacterium]|nr:MAG: HlyD family type I secretion periplasmic adaptor subunit [Betaproteobacteria bacterium]